MIRQSGGNLFDKQDHILLQQVSTRRESSENIQPISITDIEFIQQDLSSERPRVRQITSIKTDYDNGLTSSNAQTKSKKDDSTLIIPQSPSLSKKESQQQYKQQEQDGQMLFDDLLSVRGAQRTQVRAVAQTIQRNQSQDKQTDLSLFRTDLDSSYLNVETNFLKKRLRSSMYSQKNVDESKQTINQSNTLCQSFLQQNPTNYNIGKQQTIKVEVEDEEEEYSLKNIKKTIRQQIIKVLFQILEGTHKRRFQSLTTKHLQLIKDKSYHIQVDEKTKTTTIFKCFSLLQWKILSSTFQIKQLFKRLINKIPIILPTNAYNMYLNILSMVSLISIFFLYSFSIFFFFVGNSFSHAIEIVSIVLSFFDISSRFFVGIYNKGEIVSDRLFIFKAYIKTTFFIDFISSMSIILSALRISQNYEFCTAVQSIFFIRLFSTQQSFQKMDHLIHIIGKANNLYQLFKLVLKLVILCHIISITYYTVAVIEQRYLLEDKTWVDTLFLNDSNWYEKYVYAFFYAFNTVMLNTQNNLNVIESLFTIIVMCSTIGTFAYIMSSISDILEAENKKKREFKQDLETINQYMRKKNLKKEIQSKVCNFLEYLYEEKGDIKNNKEAIHVLKRLPLNLREDIQQDINTKVVESFSSICNTFSDKIKKRTIQIIEEECFLPNEIIFKQGSCNNQALYLVQKGKGKQIKISINNNQIIFSSLTKVLLENVQSNGDTVTFSIQEKNGIFGEKNFFSGLAFDYQARSGDFTTLYKIPRKEFIEVIQSSNDDFEQFCVTRDSILLEKNSPFLQVSCKICDSKYHTESACDKVHFSSNVSHVIKKYLYSEFAERNICSRKLRLRTNATHFVNQMREVCDRITSNPDLLPILEMIELDNNAQFNREDSNFSSEAGSNFEPYDEGEEEDEEEEENQEEKEGNDQDDFESAKQDIKSLQHKINSNFMENQIIEEREDCEESPLQIIDKNNIFFDKINFVDGFSLSQLSNSAQNSPKVVFQNQNPVPGSYLLNYYVGSGMKQGQIQRSNQNLISQPNSISSIPLIIPSQSKLNYQNSRNTHLSQEDLMFKSSTLSSQNTQQSFKKSKLQFEDHHIEQQKSAFSRRKHKKQKCVILPKSFSKNYSKNFSKNYSEQQTNQSKKMNNSHDDSSQFGLFQQLSKMNTLIEKQLSYQDQSIKLHIDTDSQQKVIAQNQQNLPQQEGIQQQLLLFDQIKQNFLEFQKATPINSILFSNDFERMKKYRIYFPLGNYTYIISTINKNQKLQIKNTKKRLHVKTWTFINKLNAQEQNQI